MRSSMPSTVGLDKRGPEYICLLAPLSCHVADGPLHSLRRGGERVAASPRAVSYVSQFAAPPRAQACWPPHVLSWEGPSEAATRTRRARRSLRWRAWLGASCSRG